MILPVAKRPALAIILIAGISLFGCSSKTPGEEAADHAPPKVQTEEDKQVEAKFRAMPPPGH